MRLPNRLVQCAGLVCLLVATFSRAAAGQENNQPPPGFTSLFNGRDIDHWTGGLTRDPREIASLPPEEKSKWEAKMQQGIREHWRVADGVLVSDGKDPFLATKKDYRDFEMWVDWLIGPKGDSGIYLRGTPQVQIWDPNDENVQAHGAGKGSGGLWNNKKHERFPAKRADRPVGQWNRMHIRMVGPFVSVKLNDELVTNNVVMENYYKPELPVYPSGPIYLQTHGAETRFRNVFIREIDAEESNELLTGIARDEDEFHPLFNGKDLTGWRGATQSYEVEGGILRCKKGGRGNLISDEVFDDFVLRFEFKLPPGGNNGVGIRAPDEQTELAYSGMEIQLLDDAAPQYADIYDYQVHASLYGLAPAHRGYLRPTGEWNFQEISADGERLTVMVNGYEVLNVDISQVRKQPLDGREHPGAARKSGHIALCAHNDPVELRNLRIKRLPAQK